MTSATRVPPHILDVAVAALAVIGHQACITDTVPHVAGSGSKNVAKAHAPSEKRLKTLSTACHTIGDAISAALGLPKPPDRLGVSAVLSLTALANLDQLTKRLHDQHRISFIAEVRVKSVTAQPPEQSDLAQPQTTHGNMRTTYSARYAAS